MLSVKDESEHNGVMNAYVCLKSSEEGQTGLFQTAEEGKTIQFMVRVFGYNGDWGNWMTDGKPNGNPVPQQVDILGGWEKDTTKNAYVVSYTPSV